jgi:hypothetical protein
VEALNSSFSCCLPWAKVKSCKIDLEFRGFSLENMEHDLQVMDLYGTFFILLGMGQELRPIGPQMTTVGS